MWQDVSLGSGGGDGPRTTRFLRQCAARHPAFVPVVLVLKLMLEQRSCNKAFTGGARKHASA